MTAQELIARYGAGERDFSGADLGGVDLNHAYLDGVDLRGAILKKADLRGANLSYASLRGADLRGAVLIGSNLLMTDLLGAACRGVVLWETHLVDVDLTPLCAGWCAHLGPSPVDWRSIARSLCAPGLEGFLADCGMPPALVGRVVESLRAQGPGLSSMMRSTFISYGGPDEAFARKLYEALRAHGVSAFFFPEHAVPGDRLHRMMRKGINEHDRVILICSQGSLHRRGVQNEIEEVLAREARDGGAAYLIPIRLDDYVFRGWSPPSPDVAQTLRDRVVADFTGTLEDPAKFEAGLQRILKALRKDEAPG